MSTRSNSGPHEQSLFHYTGTLLALMQERIELLEALCTLAESQAIAASHAEVDSTLGLLARKQSLLDELSGVQARLRPYFDDDPEQRRWESPGHRQRCQQLAQQGQRLLQRTLQLESESLHEMTARRDAVAAQLQDGRDSILAHTAYMADSSLEVSSLDISDL